MGFGRHYLIPSMKTWEVENKVLLTEHLKHLYVCGGDSGDRFATEPTNRGEAS